MRLTTVGLTDIGRFVFTRRNPALNPLSAAKTTFAVFDRGAALIIAELNY